MNGHEDLDRTPDGQDTQYRLEPGHTGMAAAGAQCAIDLTQLAECGGPTLLLRFLLTVPAGVARSTVLEAILDTLMASPSQV